MRSRHVPCRPAAVGAAEAGAAEALGGSNVRRRWRGSACRRVDGRVGEPSWRPGARPLPPPPGDGRRDGESECGAALGVDSTRKGGDTLCSCGVSHALTPSPAYTSDWKTGSQSRMGSVRVRARDELLRQNSRKWASPHAQQRALSTAGDIECAPEAAAQSAKKDSHMQKSSRRCPHLRVEPTGELLTNADTDASIHFLQDKQKTTAC